MLRPGVSFSLIQCAVSVVTNCETQYIDLDKGSMYAISEIDFPALLACNFEFTYPTDSFLQVHLIVETFGNGRYNLTDAFDDSLERAAPEPPSSELTLYYPPPSFLFTLNTTGESSSYSSVFQTAHFKAVKSSAFNKTDTFSITPSSMPLLIDVDTLSNGKTYLFKGNPQLSAIALPDTSSITTKSIMIYNGSQSDSLFGTMYGMSGWQEFTNLGLYNIDYKRNSEKTDLFFVMDTSDLNTYQTPQIFRCDIQMMEVQNVQMNSTAKRSFVNFLQYEQQKNEKICQYRISKFDFSEDVLFEIYDGLPQRTMSKKSLVRSFDPTDLEEELTFLLTGSKTIVLLNGTMSFDFVQNTFVSEDEANNVFVVNERNSLVWSAPYLGLDVLEYNITWFGNNGSNVHLGVNDLYHSEDVKFGKEISFTSAYSVTFTLNGKSMIHYTVTKTAWGTAAPQNYPTRLPPTQDDYSCVQFRFFDCIFFW